MYKYQYKCRGLSNFFFNPNRNWMTNKTNINWMSWFECCYLSFLQWLKQYIKWTHFLPTAIEFNQNALVSSGEYENVFFVIWKSARSGSICFMRMVKDAAHLEFSDSRDSVVCLLECTILGFCESLFFSRFIKMWLGSASLRV